MVWPVRSDPRKGDEVRTDYNVAQSKLEHLLKLDLDKPEACTRSTGIMATIGPSSRDPIVLEKMMSAGMNMARLNASYDSPEQRSELVKALRSAARLYGLKMGYVYPLAIALDICGPVIRTGIIDNALKSKICLNTDDEVILTTDEAYREKVSHRFIYIDYPRFSLKGYLSDLNIKSKRRFMCVEHLPPLVVLHIKKQCSPPIKSVHDGQVVYIDNELLKLRVKLVSGSTVICKVERGGTLASQRDVKMPGVKIDLPRFSERDKEDIYYAVHKQLDMIIVSYVEKAETLKELRELLGEKGKKIAIICKIQSSRALNNLDAIMQASDSIIIARQELGTDINSRNLMKAQKNITTRAMAMGKPCGVLAQVFHSMNYERIPLRAEVMDAGNCVLDGVDYLLLSAETASGPRPVESISVLADVLKEAESCVWAQRLLMDLIDEVPSPCTPVEGVTLSAALAAQKYGAAAIVVITTSGRSAALLARFRPHCPVLAVTRYSLTSRQLHMYRGIIPIVYEDQPESTWHGDIAKRTEFCLKFGYDNGFLRVGDPIILITGWKQGQGFTNTMRLITAEPISLKSVNPALAKNAT